MTTQRKKYFVTGATGQQGGAVARRLLDKEQQVRVLTRNPDKAAALKNRGAEVVVGDMTDSTVLDQALIGIDAVFAMSTFLEAGMDAEVEQGKTLADAAKKANVAHYVYASVGSAERNTGIPHFEVKWQVEQHIAQLGLPATILRPVFFMENFSTFFPPSAEGKLVMPLRLDTKLQMIAVDDIATFAVEAFLRPNDFMGKAIEIAGDVLTMPEVAAQLSRTMKRTITFESMSIEQAEPVMGKDFATMFKWFNDVGYAADVQALQQQYGVSLTTFADLISSADWAKG